jgi:hypothetical protein
MDQMTRDYRTQERVIGAILDDPTLEMDNPEFQQALVNYQQQTTFGSPSSREDADHELWQTARKTGRAFWDGFLVAGKGQLNAIQQTMRSYQQVAGGVATMVRGTFDSIINDYEALVNGVDQDRMDHLRSIMQMYATNPDEAKRLTGKLRGRERQIMDAVPDPLKPAAGMPWWERIYTGYTLGPGAVAPAQEVLRNMHHFYAEEEYNPAQSRISSPFGLKDLNFKVDLPGSNTWLGQLGYVLGAEVSMDPVSWVGASKAPKAAIYLAGKGRVTRNLGPEGVKAYKEIMETVRGPLRRKEMRTLTAGEYTDPSTGIKRHGVKFPAADDVFKARQEEAEMRAWVLAEEEAARRVGKLADMHETGSGAWIDNGSLFYSPFWTKGDPIPGTAGVMNAGRWLAQTNINKMPTAMAAVRATWEQLEGIFNELPYEARRHGGFPQMVAAARAEAGRESNRISQWIDKTFGDMSKDQARAIGEYMSVRTSPIRSEEFIANKFKVIDPEHQHIPDIIDRMLSRPFRESELYNNVNVHYRPGYFPQRYMNKPADYEMLREQVIRDPNAQFSTKFDPQESFQMDRMFHDPQEAVEYAASKGITFDPIYDFREAFRLRGYEHANSMAQMRLFDRSKKFFGYSTSQLDRQTFHRYFPEHSLNVETELRDIFPELGVPFRGMPEEGVVNIPREFVTIPKGTEALIARPEDAVAVTRRFIPNVKSQAHEAALVREGGAASLEEGRRAGLFREREPGGVLVPMPHPLVARGFFDFLKKADVSPILRRPDRSPKVKFAFEQSPQARLFSRSELDAKGHGYLKADHFYEVTSELRRDPSGSWEIVFGPGASRDDVLETTINWLRKSGHDSSLEVLNPELNRAIINFDKEVGRPGAFSMLYTSNRMHGKIPKRAPKLPAPMVKMMDDVLEDFPVESIQEGSNTPASFTTPMVETAEAADQLINTIRQEEMVGHGLRQFENVLDELKKNPKIGQRALDKWRPFYRALSKENRASLTVGAMHVLGERGSFADFETFTKVFSKQLAAMDAPALDVARQKLGIMKEQVLMDHFGQPYVRMEAKPFEGYYLPKGLADYMNGKMAPKLKRDIWDRINQTKLMQTADLLQDTHKFMITAPFPSFHARNSYSNIAQAMVDIGISSLDPRLHGHATAIINGWDGFVTIQGKKVPYSRIRNEAERTGVIRGAMHTMDYRDAEGALRSKWRQILGGEKFPTAPTPTPGAGVKAHPSRFGNWIENEARMMLYLRYRKMDGVSPASASLATDRIFFDYRSLSTADQMIFKRMFPFWVWNKKNIALTAKQLVARPGRMSAQFKALGHVMPPPEDYGPDEVFLPDYLSGSIRIGWKDEGEQHFLTGIDLPVTSAFELAVPRPVSDAMQAWVSMAGPPRTLLDVYGWGRDPFTKAETGPTARMRVHGLGQLMKAVRDNVPGGDWVAKWAQFRETQDDEGNSFYTVNAAKGHVFLKGAFLARMSGTTDRLIRRYLEPEGFDFLGAMLDIGLGVRLHQYDLSDRQGVRLRKNIRYLESVAKERERVYDPPITAVSNREVVP